MILHITEDEKFIDHVINVFETVNTNNNIYLVNSKSDKLKLVKSKHQNIIIQKYGSSEYTKIITDKHNFSAVIFHNLIYPYKWDILKNISENIKIHWMSWGGDLYPQIPQLRKNLYQKETKKYLTQQYSLKKRIAFETEKYSPSFYNKIYSVIKKEPGFFFKFKSAVKKIGSISTVLPSEHFLVKKYLNPNIQYFPFKYGTIESLTAGLSKKTCNGQDFLIGNSANPTNNHLDTFKFLSSKNYENSLLYTPLSYGNNNYAHDIITSGEQIFGKTFIPLKSFLSVADYGKILLHCGNVIINSNRQQAMGNILISLWFGAKVFLNNYNLTYNFFNEIGIRFFDIKNLSNVYNMTNFEELSAHNKPIIERLYRLENVLSEAENLVSFLSEKKRSF